MLEASLLKIRERLLALDEDEAVAWFAPVDCYRSWKTTISLCPVCLAHVPALIFERAGKIFMRKRCETHGASEALIENDSRYYRLSNKDRWGRRYSGEAELRIPYFGADETPPIFEGSAPVEFAGQKTNKSCTILVEVTDACNLACAVCYSDARGNRKLPFEDFKKYLLDTVASKGVLDSVQLTGGEAILHPQFWEMIDFLHGLEAVRKIYLPTNGIEFSKPQVAEKLTNFREKVMVLLQFDAASASGNQALRNANTVGLREKVIENLARQAIHTQLTMTITLGVNDSEIGWVTGMGMKFDHIKVVALQPVTYSGRYDLSQDPLQRLTLSDVIKAVLQQTSATVEKDFQPIPCSHPNCGWITLYVRRFGLRVNIARHIDLGRAMNQVANRTLLNTNELRSAIGAVQPNALARAGQWVGKKLVRSTDVFAVAIKPFMDRFNYDLDRVTACCHHLMDTRGRLVSFCEYNARMRPLDPWTRFPPLKS